MSWPTAARRSWPTGGHIDFIKPLETFASGELGYCVGICQATNAGVTVDGRILLVIREIRGKWMIVAHQTVVRDQP
jgi:ketosteroid isomerase-like protein